MFLQGRREVLEGLHQFLVAVDLDLQFADDVLIGHPVAVEFQVLVRHFFQGVCQVEGVILLLGIEHQGQFVAVFDEFYEHLVLLDFILRRAFRILLQLQIGVAEFIVQDGQGLGQILFLEHGAGRQAQDKDGGQGDEMTDKTFHVDFQR